MITYENIFLILEKQNKNKAWLRNNGINARTVDKLIHNQNVNITTINEICNLLNVEPKDILTYTKDKEEN